MSAAVWNHNIHYHDLVVGSIPRHCRRALDVGCGTGLLARRLSRHCEEVVGIDLDHGAITRARAASSSNTVGFIEGDAMTYPFSKGSFDFIAVAAALHHLPLRPALTRFQDLLRTGGILAIVGLYRARTLQDYVWSAAALPTSLMLRCVRSYADVGAPVKEPEETLREIRSACDSLLPGSVLRRRLLFRYFIEWRKA